LKLHLKEVPMLRVLPPAARDGALLVARVVLGVVLLAHGLQKFGEGFQATADDFSAMGIPLSPVAAVFAIVVEVVGAVALIVGAATALVGVLVVIDMIGAYLFAHFGLTVFVDDNGWELVGVIAVAALVLAAVGAGRFSVDHVVASRTERRTPATV
jgi:putative oxidoreductase